MFTVLIILSSESFVSFEVKHFKTRAEAEAYKPTGVNCSAVVAEIYKGSLSADNAICEYLD